MSHAETVILPLELTNGNDGRGHKFWSSAKARKDIEKKLRLKGFARSPFLFPVKVTVTRILGPGQRLWDSSSIGRGNWKEAEDALVALGWFVDDSPRYVTQTIFNQDACRRKQGPAIELTVEQDGDPFAADTKTAEL